MRRAQAEWAGRASKGTGEGGNAPKKSCPTCEDPGADLADDLEGCSPPELALVYVNFCTGHPEFSKDSMATLVGLGDPLVRSAGSLEEAAALLRRARHDRLGNP